MSICFAPGVLFEEDTHEYFLKGRALSGITGIIGKKLALKMPEQFMEEHRDEGIHVHKAIQSWVEGKKIESVHPGVDWITNTFYAETCEPYTKERGAVKSFNAEVLVSDLEQYASAVDIVVEWPDKTVDIYDIKNGIFKRDYCTLQLSIYKYFIEKFTVYNVRTCMVIGVKDKEYWPIFPKPFSEIEKLLYGTSAA
jgi:hypothetical protein